jgi:hypothetical protein
MLTRRDYKAALLVGVLGFLAWSVIELWFPALDHGHNHSKYYSSLQVASGAAALFLLLSMRRTGK